MESLKSKLEELKNETLQNKALEKITLDEIKTQFDCSSLNELISLRKEIEKDNEDYKEELVEGIEELKNLIRKHGLLDD